MRCAPHLGSGIHRNSRFSRYIKVTAYKFSLYSSVLSSQCNVESGLGVRLEFGLSQSVTD